MNKYKIEVRRWDRSNEDYDLEIEAPSAQDAVFIANFNDVSKSTDFHGKPTHSIYRVLAMENDLVLELTRK